MEGWIRGPYDAMRDSMSTPSSPSSVGPLAVELSCRESNSGCLRGSTASAVVSSARKRGMGFLAIFLGLPPRTRDPPALAVGRYAFAQ